MEKHNNNHPLYLFVVQVFLFVSYLIPNQVGAFSFLTYEARAAAMGGVGVATETRNASYYNPALLATSDDSFDWYAILPAFSEAVADPSALHTKMDAYKISPNNTTLAAMGGVSRRERENTAMAFGVPSTIISGTVFINKHQFHTTNARIIPGDHVGSIMEHRTAEVREFGFALAKPANLALLDIGELKLGVGVKLLLVDGFADDQNMLSTTEEHVFVNDVTQSSAINFDLGVAREVGVWKMALVVKNLLTSSHRFGSSDDVFRIEPQIRAGFAFRSRRSVYEVDLDLLRNQHVGHERQTQHIAGGWEHRLIPGFSVRLGVRQSLVGDPLPTFSYGIGAEFFGVIFDFAGMNNSDENSFFAQLTLQQ